MADTVHVTPLNSVVAFLIGLSIVLLASILNAAGLNLTKLDHVRTSAIPKAVRPRDWMRPLWLLGMLLYILSQLLGSTLALEYMRAEYVAPLGSTSLVFNFLFARFLVGTPVTSTDIYGTVVVILGVIGIVAFGSINSGLASETDVTHLTYLWRRPGWLSFFFCMTGALLTLLVVTGRLDAVLLSRGDLSSNPSTAESSHGRVQFVNSNSTNPTNDSDRPRKWWICLIDLIRGIRSAMRQIIRGWTMLMIWITSWLEIWTSAQDDKQIAWTLGIGWSCCGGGLAGACLVFAKATVKLLTGSLSKQNPGNQFGHAAPVFTIILLAATAVLQIICLNRGLRVYDSTLVVPVFYGVYTATGFLDSLIFNDEVDAYQSWTLFLIFASILVLISGVVLLTHKKPEPIGNVAPLLGRNHNKDRDSRKPDEEEGGNIGQDRDSEQAVLWAVANNGEDDFELEDGDEDIDHHQNPTKDRLRVGEQHPPNVTKGKGKDSSQDKFKGKSWRVKRQDEEGIRLIGETRGDDDNDDNDNDNDEDARLHKHPSDIDAVSDSEERYFHHSLGMSGSSNASLRSTGGLKSADLYRDEDDFGDWEDSGTQVGRR